MQITITIELKPDNNRALPKGLKKNLRYTLGDKVIELFGSYNEENEKKLAGVIGISGTSLSGLLHDGKICDDDLSSICYFLKPTAELQQYWWRHYCGSEINHGYWKAGG